MVLFVLGQLRREVHQASVANRIVTEVEQVQMAKSPASKGRTKGPYAVGTNLRACEVQQMELRQSAGRGRGCNGAGALIAYIILPQVEHIKLQQRLASENAEQRWSCLWT